MTRADRQARRCAGDLLTSPVRVDRAAVPCLRIRWEIDASSIPGWDGPDAPSPSGAAAAAGPARAVTLEWIVTAAPDARREARAELHEARLARRTPLAVVSASRDDLATPVRCTTDDDLHHIEIEGLLTATLRVLPASETGAGLDHEAGPSVQVLYARTSLLAQLGVPGGRYEVAGAELVDT